MTVRLLAQYQGNPPNTIVTLAGGVETALVAAGNASTDLSGGVPPAYISPINSQVGDVLYGPDGVPLGIADAAGKLLLNFNGITVPGTPTGVALTPIAGGVLAAFTPSATLGGTVGTGFEVTLSNGRVQRGAAAPIVVNSPAGAVTATVKQINGAGLSAASSASASVTVPAYTVPSAPGAPTGLTLAAGNGKVTASWTAAASNGSAIRNTVVSLSNGASATALAGATTVDVTTPNGTAVTATARASNGEGSGPVSAVSNSVVPAEGPALKAFNTTGSFAQGDQVLYAGGVYSMTAAHAPGNWTGNDATYLRQNGDSPLNTVGFSKPMGVVQSWTAGVLATGNTSTPTQSRGLKMDAEAPFTKVRAAMFQREPTPQRGYALSVASTETDAVGSLSNAINPIVNGTAHNVLKGADPYGFSKLTWGGAARSPVQPGCGVTVPGQGYATNMSSVFSDWVDCASVPVVTGKRPMLVARLSRIVSIGDANSNVSTNGTTGSYNRYVANDPTGRLLINMLAGTNGDHVADPTLSQATGATYDPTTVSSWQNMAFMFEHGIPARVFGGFGDSITEGYGIWQTPVLQLSTQKAPCYTANFGCSTNRSAQYLALLESQLRGENYLTDIIIPSFSPNEVQAMTDTLADGFIAELARMVALCAAYKKRLYIWTSYAALTTRYSGSPTAVAAINKINDWVRTEAAKAGATFQLIEIATGYDNATMTIGGSDNTHPNATGVAHFNSRILPAIQKGI